MLQFWALSSVLVPQKVILKRLLGQQKRQSWTVWIDADHKLLKMVATFPLLLSCFGVVFDDFFNFFVVLRCLRLVLDIWLKGMLHRS